MTHAASAGIKAQTMLSVKTMQLSRRESETEISQQLLSDARSEAEDAVRALNSIHSIHRVIIFNLRLFL